MVAGKKRVPRPAAGITALNTLDPIVITPYADHVEEKSQTRRVLRNLRKLAPEGDERASSLLLEQGIQPPLGVPIRAAEIKTYFKRVGKAAKPDEKEVKENVRSRSAVLRIGEKIA